MPELQGIVITMGDYSKDVITAARSRVGLPFRHHFKPENNCNSGTATNDSCMEKGMDNSGYDCSGLVVASICEVLGVKTNQWPREYRHMVQLEELAVDENVEAGDPILLYLDPGENGVRRTHMGIFVAEQCVIHASGITGIVEEGGVEGVIDEVRFISSAAIVDLLQSQDREYLTC